MLLHCRNIDKSFGNNRVLNQINLSLAVGEIAVLLGPSGCGKTTLLRVIAGLTLPDSGHVFLNEQDITAWPVHERGLGMVFQEYALFPHKNVFQNVAFGLRMLNWPKDEIELQVGQVLDLVGLANFGPRPIHELSGGEQQRVALARSLAPAPRLILLDEPLGALDRALRERLMHELRQILKDAGNALGRPEGMTAVYVTHDQTEAFALADKLVVLNEGHIEQIDSPQNVYRQPATPFIARFLGMENVFRARLISLNPPLLKVGNCRLAIAPPTTKNSALALSKESRWLIRPEAARLVDEAVDQTNIMNGRLVRHSFRGRYQIITVETDDNPPVTLKFELETAVSVPAIGRDVSLAIDPDGILPLESG